LKGKEPHNQSEQQLIEEERQERKNYKPKGTSSLHAGERNSELLKALLPRTNNSPLLEEAEKTLSRERA